MVANAEEIQNSYPQKKCETMSLVLSFQLMWTILEVPK